ncbi:acyltransferase family protein [Rhizobium ruizarguesonis]|jgi:peptidoglycan/LPS O-acetylase OafA/YrhL|uniref:acyltransferase family protein n=2 Tax=Rhizobium ruizarguesonis TaxID=2081791 RepID=UPI0010307D91|nr:acyltransferase [Rhizobium ruizarguesonis]TAZ71697.1 acyltransferase [Rhizobium ruizarguesonis]TAZ98370.1 acyltransferase [Rhizobium ruizarguesonis]TBA14973.1 acyltransferase [Rhizobium ruizarguesonis]TBB85773.1 acyltransferase [Rhizobium ruizarguesonis]TBC42707.1 acyltransferase [Rhizobium ruizarguesonis]
MNGHLSPQGRALASERRDKNLALEGLRGIACLSVFLCHFLFSFFPYLTSNFSRNSQLLPTFAWENVASLPIATVFFNGNFGVAIFFAMSGFLLTNRYFHSDDKQVLSYGAAKRYLRLGLPAAASIIIAWMLLTLGWMFTQEAAVIGAAGWPAVFYKEPTTFWRALADAVYGAAVFGQTELNSPLWTIQIELIGSLLLFATYSFFGVRYCLVNLAFFVGAVLVMFPNSQAQIHCLTIFAGSLLNYVRFERLRSRPINAALIGTGFVLGAYDYSYWFEWMRIVPFPTFGAPVVDLAQYDRYVFNAFGAILVVAGLLSSKRVSALFSSNILAYLGRLSFSIYLLHWPITCSLAFGMMYAFKVKLGWDYQVAAIITFCASLMVTLCASWLFERYVDNPSQKLAGHFAKEVLAPTRRNVRPQKQSGVAAVSEDEVDRRQSSV